MNRRRSQMARVILILFGALAAVAQPASAQEPSSPDGTPLRIATWNLLNLFDNIDHPDRPDEGTDPKSYWNLKLMAEAVDALDVDVLGVQEVESRDILVQLNSHLAHPFAFVELLEGNDGRGIDVGVLSRLPLDRASSHRNTDIGGEHRFARDFPVFRIWPAEHQPIEIGVVHFKSKRGEKEQSDAWRRAEAEGVRRIILERRARSPQVPFIVMGDFNDHRDAETLEPLFSFLDDATVLCPIEDRDSFGLPGRREQIDFILTTSDLEATRAEIIHREDRVSDHDAIVVEFTWKGEIQRQTVPAGMDWEEPTRPQLSATDLDGLRNHLLQEVAATGVVTKIHRTRSGSAAILNFAEDYRQAVTARIYSEAQGNFPDLDSLVGKTVTVRGPVCFDRGVFRIQMTNSEQLSVAK